MLHALLRRDEGYEVVAVGPQEALGPVEEDERRSLEVAGQEFLAWRAVKGLGEGPGR